MPKQSEPRPGRKTLLLAILVFVLLQAVWLRLDHAPPSWDQAAHAQNSLKYLRFFTSPLSTWSSLRFLTISGYWPPLFYISTVPLTLVLGFSPDVLVLANLFYLGLFVWSLYRIGFHLFRNASGAGAALMTLCCPLVYAVFRDVLLDFALLAVVTFAQWTILESEAGLSPRKSWKMGLGIGAALLVKWTALPFLLPTWLAVLILSLRGKKISMKQAWAGILIAGLVASAIALPWYYTVRAHILEGARGALLIDPIREGDPLRFDWTAVRWYAGAFKSVILSSLLLPFFLAAWAAAARIRPLRAWPFLLAWIVPSLLVFLALPNKDARFVLPLLPAAALLAAAGVSALPWKSVRTAFWTAFLACALLQYFCISFSWPRAAPHPYTHPPLAAEWPIDAVLADLEAAYPGKRLFVAVLANEEYFNPSLFRLRADYRNASLNIEAVGESPLKVEDLARFPVLIAKTGSIAAPHTAVHRRAFMDALQRAGPEAFGYRLLSRRPLPDSSEALVFVRD